MPLTSRTRPARHEPDYLAFHPPLLRLQETMPHPLGRKVLWVLGALLGFIIVWALVGRLDIVAVADGKLVPESYLKIVQPAEAGIVREILVREGDAVETDQVLMRMDALMTEADANALEAEYHRKRLALKRIDAELAERTLALSGESPESLAQEIVAQFQANRAALSAALAEERSRFTKAKEELAAAEQMKLKLEAVLPHYREQEAAFERLTREGFAGPLMTSDKRRERIEKEQELAAQRHTIESARASVMQSERKLAQINSDNRKQLYAERQEVQAAFDRLTEERAKLTHRRQLLELKAPQDGIVKELATHTMGTVVQPGTVLTTLVPKGETLKAEVWMKNEDIGFVHPGQPVKLKLAAYPFQKYGLLTGSVYRVSADASDVDNNGTLLANTSPSAQGKPAIYKVLVSLDAQHLDRNGQRLTLSAGMQAMAEIKLGDRTVAEYLLSPVQQAWHEAGRER